MRARRLFALAVVGALAAATLSALPAVQALDAASASAAPPANGVSRLWGASRYETSADISAKTFSTGVPVAYVASGHDFPDALSGAALAARTGGPVLLTAPDGLPAATAAELARLAPGRIAVLGGPGAVSDSVAAQLGAYTRGGVARLAGDDRFETSVDISAAAFPQTAPIVFLASGADFPDALSSAAAAGALGGPVLLTRPDVLPAAVAAELARLKPGRVIVVGGENAVAASVASAAQSATGRVVERFAGVDRYATAAAIARLLPSPARAVYLATGATFADAVSGAVAAAVTASPLLLTPSTSLTDSVGSALVAARTGSVVLLGGPASVSSDIESRLREFALVRTAASGATLTTSTQIAPGTCLSAATGTTSLCVTEAGAVEVRSGSQVRWSSGTTAAPSSLRIRSDGALVLYSLAGGVIWSSNTPGSGSVRVSVTASGDVQLQTASGAVTWASMTGTSSPKWGLPFEAGQRWSAGGPHASSGANQTRHALDFGPNGSASRRVVTIAAGTVFEITCGGGRSYLGVRHGGGWESGYYHLVNEQRSLIGTTVPAGTYLGDAGQALPCGGGSTFAHVHLTIRHNGTPVSVEGMTFGGYTIRNTGSAFSGVYVNAAGTVVLRPENGARCCLQAPTG